MLKRLTQIDALLIDGAFQPAADFLFQYWEIDCFRIARFCADVSALAWIMSQARGMVAAAKTGQSGIVAFYCALIVIVLVAIMTVRSVFERGSRTGRMGQSGTLNPLRAQMFAHRLIFAFGLISKVVQMTISPIEFSSLALLAMQGFLAVAGFMGACSNRPPKRRQFGLDHWRALGFQNR